MAPFTSDFLSLLNARGFISQCSHPDELDARAREGNLVAYAGYDCTAPSLHVGHLLSMMMLMWLEKTGAGKPIVLMGGGTTLVGDPSGRDETRKLLTPQDIANNKASIAAAFSSFLDFKAPQGARLLDNSQWLVSLNYLEFLRDIGRHFSINRMLSMDSVKNRLDREQELSFLEFNYMLLQSYDFVHLARTQGCTLQIGGSDQWGNIVMGIDLGRRLKTPQLYGLTCPLLTTASGAKMGKTAAGAVWLNPDLCSVYDYWQYWRNTEDADVGKFLRLFTTLDLDEIARLEALSGQELNEAKKILATEATALLHGHPQALEAEKTAIETFEKGETSAGLDTFDLGQDFEKNGLSILSALVQTGLCRSNGEAKRAISGGGVRVNNTTVVDERLVLGPTHLNAHETGGAIKLSLGKKRHVLLVFPAL